MRRLFSRLEWRTERHTTTPEPPRPPDPWKSTRTNLSGGRAQQNFPSPQSRFAYPPLTKSAETRLLLIHAGAHRDNVYCDLFKIDLDNLSCKYEALSYVWGASSKPCKIYLGPAKEAIPITVNADAALRRLRHTNRSRLVWIDAICIDQTNIPERNAQATMMPRIYKTASRVIVDLGTATPEVELAIMYLQEIACRNPTTDVMSPHQEGRPLRVCDMNCPVWFTGKKSTEADKKFWLGPVNEHWRPAVWVDEKTPTSITPRFPTKQEVQSLLRLFEYPWFTRAWVVQEMYHAADVTVVCDPYSFEWISLEWFIEKWNQGRDRMGMFTLPYMVNVRNPVRPAKRLWSLLNSSFRACASTDSRDKLYSIISLAADYQPHILPVDYSASAASVFLRAASILFYQVGLNVLGATRGRSRIPGMPSWVPDWTMSCDEDKLYNKTDPDVMLPWTPAGGPPDWTVAELVGAPRGSPNWPSGHPGLLLKARGVKLGRICWVGESWDLEKGDWKATVQQWKRTAQCLDICQYPFRRPISQSLSEPDPSSESVSLQEHASKAQYPTQANGGYTITDLDVFDNLLAAGAFKDVHDPQKERMELEEKNGMEQLWQCHFDDDTLFIFNWRKGPESKFFQDVNITRENKPSRGEIFYRTIIADDYHSQGSTWELGAFHLFGEPLYASDKNVIAPSKGSSTAVKDEAQRWEEVRIYEESAKRAMAGRRFFITEEGYVGLAPKEAEVNDVAVVLLGHRVPCVLRSKASPWNFDFVGECYVFGANQGEAVRHIHVSRLLAKFPKAPLGDYIIW